MVQTSNPYDLGIVNDAPKMEKAMSQVERFQAEQEKWKLHETSEIENLNRVSMLAHEHNWRERYESLCQDLIHRRSLVEVINVKIALLEEEGIRLRQECEALDQSITVIGGLVPQAVAPPGFRATGSGQGPR